MKALSIKQPWASLIAHGLKNIENRTWKTHFRGTIYIHASAKGVPDFTFNEEQHQAIPSDINCPYSAIIGEVDIVDCVINHDSIWAEKTPCAKTGNLIFHPQKPTYNWVLSNPVLYEQPILNVKGKLSFWEPDICIVTCESCGTPTDMELTQTDSDDNYFCLKCWKELGPVLQKEYEELKAKGEID